MNRQDCMLRLVYRPTDRAGEPQGDAIAVTATAGESIEIGRDGEMTVGVDPTDEGISRIALTVTATDEGWLLLSGNRNGAVIHRWGQQPEWVLPGATQRVAWPRIGVRLIGSRTNLHHWMLLEADRYATAPRPQVDSGDTVTGDSPDPLTGAQLDALKIVFGPHLAWPPVLGPVPVTLDSAGRRLGVSDGAIYQRLQAAQQRAYRLGSHQQLGVTDPDYLYVLVAHGYLPFPSQVVAARDLYGGDGS